MSQKKDKSFENVVKFKYLGKIQTNQNLTCEEIKKLIKFRECLPPFALWKYKDYSIENCV
jgi:hypothetical protein